MGCVIRQLVNVDCKIATYFYAPLPSGQLEGGYTIAFFSMPMLRFRGYRLRTFAGKIVINLSGWPPLVCQGPLRITLSLFGHIFTGPGVQTSCRLPLILVLPTIAILSWLIIGRSQNTFAEAFLLKFGCGHRRTRLFTWTLCQLTEAYRECTFTTEKDSHH